MIGGGVRIGGVVLNLGECKWTHKDKSDGGAAVFLKLF
jgi:hypothetical protein